MTSAPIRAMVRAMQAAGCPAEQIVAAVVAFDDGADVREAERRAKDRDRKRAERAKATPPASEPVQRTNGDSADGADSTDWPGSPQPSPKVPPKDNNQTPFLAPDPPPFPSREGAEIDCVSAGKTKGREDFEAFWRAMPSPNPAAKSSAQAAFAKLEASERPQAILAAGRYAKAFADKPTTHPISPTRFLRERCFEGYAAASPASEVATVFVRLDTPQWRSWTAHRGKPIPVNKEGTGWRFPSEWPPGADAA